VQFCRFALISGLSRHASGSNEIIAEESPLAFNYSFK